MMVSIGDLDLVADSCLLDLDPFMSVTSDSAVASGLFRGMLRNIDTIVRNWMLLYVVFLHFNVLAASVNRIRRIFVRQDSLRLDWNQSVYCMAEVTFVHLLNELVEKDFLLVFFLFALQ